MRRISLIIFIMTAVFMFSACGSEVQSDKDRGVADNKEQIEETAESEFAVVSHNAESCIGMNYYTLKSELQNAGFKNITINKIEDLKATEPDRLGTVESISIGGNMKFEEGQEFDKEEEVIINYHVYKKCMITMHVEFVPNIFFSKYDVELKMNDESQDTLEHGESKDFEFIVEPGEYEFVFEEEGNSSVDGTKTLDVKGDINISLKITCHSDQIDIETVYMEDHGAVGENEIILTAECIDYTSSSYEEYSNILTTAGFTTIIPEPIYDIAHGSEGAGKIENVSFGGTNDIERGDIFDKDTEIIITYHANESDDPVKQSQAAADAELEPVFPKEMAKRAVVVSMTNCWASDVFMEDGNTYDTSKFHSYSYTGEYFLTVEKDGTWSSADTGTWHVENIVLKRFDTGTYLNIKCNVKKDGENYIVFNVNQITSMDNNFDESESSNDYTDHFEPSESNSFLTVHSSLITDDRDNAAVQEKITVQEESIEAEDAHQSWIENQFSWWDGRHVALSDLIKDNLNDSGSFKATDTTYIDVRDETLKSEVNKILGDAGINERVEVGDLFVIQEFTAKNAFNATVKNTAYGIVRGSDDTVLLVAIF